MNEEQRGMREEGGGRREEGGERGWGVGNKEVDVMGLYISCLREMGVLSLAGLSS